MTDTHSIVHFQSSSISKSEYALKWIIQPSWLHSKEELSWKVAWQCWWGIEETTGSTPFPRVPIWNTLLIKMPWLLLGIIFSCCVHIRPHLHFLCFVCTVTTILLGYSNWASEFECFSAIWTHPNSHYCQLMIYLWHCALHSFTYIADWCTVLLSHLLSSLLERDIYSTLPIINFLS